MIYRQEFSFESTERTRFYVITPQVNQLILETKTESGLILVRSPHTTMRVVVTELAEKGLVDDYIDNSLMMFGEDPRSTWFQDSSYQYKSQTYKHYCMDNPRRLPDQIDEDYNAGRHMRASFLAQEGVTLGIIKGQIDLGQFEDLALWEFDGRDGKGINPKRVRRFLVWVIPEEVTNLPARLLRFEKNDS